MERLKIIDYNYSKNPQISLLSENEKEEAIINLFTSIQQKCLSYVENADLLVFDRIQIIKSLFIKRGPPFTPFSSTISNIYTEVYAFYHSTSKYNINIVNETLIIDYPCLGSIVEIIVKILDPIINNKKFSKILEKKILKRDFSDTPNKVLWGKTLKEHLEALNKVTSVTFILTSKEFDKDINLSSVILFIIFFHILFPSVSSIGIDLNVISVSGMERNENNPYKFVPNNITKFASKRINTFLSNIFLCELIEKYKKLNKLQIYQDESYANEWIDIYNKQWKDINFQFENYNLPVTKIMCIDVLKEITIEFNLLDPILFKSLNEILVKNSSLQVIQIIFFPIEGNFSLRKIYVNNQFYEKVNSSNKKKIDKNDLEICYPYVSDLKAPKSTISEDKILKYLFDSFSDNLNNLQLILSQRIKYLTALKLDLSPYSFVSMYDTFNSALFVFAMNVLHLIQLADNLIDFSIISNNDNCTNTHLFKKIRSVYPVDVDFSHTKLKNFEIGIKNFHIFLPLDKFPKNELRHLKFQNVSIEDFKIISEYFYKNRKKYKKIRKIEITMDFSMEPVGAEICNFFNGRIPQNVRVVKIKIENEIVIHRLIKMIKNIYDDIANLKSKLFISFEGHIQELEIWKKTSNFYSQAGGLIRQYLTKHKIIFYPHYINLTTIDISIINLPKNTKYYAFIRAFEKKYLKKNKKPLQLPPAKKINLYTSVFTFLNGKNITLRINVD